MLRINTLSEYRNIKINSEQKITLLNDVTVAENSWMRRDLNTLKMVAYRSSNNKMCKVHGNSFFTRCDVIIYQIKNCSLIHNRTRRCQKYEGNGGGDRHTERKGERKRNRMNSTNTQLRISSKKKKIQCIEV